MSARLGVRTEASTRHEKTLPLALTDLGAERAAVLLAQLGARVHPPHAFGTPIAPAAPISFAVSEVPRLLGYALSAAEIAEHLDRLGFVTRAENTETLVVTPPLWRPDVVGSADVVEEIARMAGYDRLEAAIPIVPAHEISSDEYRLERRVAQTFAALGYCEIMTYALHGPHVFQRLERAGVSPSAQVVEVRNPLSEDQRFLRYALGPGIIGYLARIVRPARVFEIGHIFYLEDRQPLESAVFSFGFTAEPIDGEPAWRDEHFLRLKGDCDALIRELTGARGEWAPDRRNGLHPGKTAVLLLDGREIAAIGRVNPRVEQAFDLQFPTYIANVYADSVPPYASPRYRPPSKFPSTYRDLALVCDAELASDRIERAIAQTLGALCTAVRAFDEYRSEQLGSDRKSVAVRVTLQKNDATITDGEADAAIARVLDRLRDELGATLRA